MIYQKDKQWKCLYPRNQIKKESLIMDFSLFGNLDSHFDQISARVNMPSSTLKKQFIEIIVDIFGIKQYVQAIILPLEMYEEKLQKTVLQGLNKLEDGGSVFDHVNNRYQGGELSLGIDIPLESLDKFPPPFATEQRLQQTRIFSIKAHINDLEKLVGIKNVKRVGTQAFHLNITLTCPEDLIKIQRFLVKEELPIERIVLTTNLIAVLQSPEGAKQLDLNIETASMSNIGYFYNLYISKYLTDSLLNLLDYHEIPTDKFSISGDKDLTDYKPLDKIFSKYSWMHRTKTRETKYTGGFVVSPSLLIPVLKDFYGGYESDKTLSGSILRHSMTGYQEVMLEKFKTLKPPSF